jgi:hypothetical protein
VSVTLLIQHVILMRYILTAFVAHLAPPHYLILSHERYVFPKKPYWTLNICFDFLCFTGLKYFSFQEEDFSEILSQV